MSETPDLYDPEDEIKAAEEYAATLRRKAEGDYAKLRAQAIEIKRTLHTLELQLEAFDEGTGKSAVADLHRLVMHRLSDVRPR